MNSMSCYDTSYQFMKEDSPYLAAIGKMIVAWAFFEHRLDVMIFNLASPTECACRIPSQLEPPASKFQAIIELCSLRQVPEHLIEELKKISQDSVPLSTRRNRFIHDPCLMVVYSCTKNMYKRSCSTTNDAKFNLTILRHLLQLWMILVIGWQKFERKSSKI